MKSGRITFSVIIIILLGSCSYMQNTLKQAQYSQTQKTNPGQRNLKHMIDRQTFFIYGLIIDENNIKPGQPLSVAAYSNKYKKNELVDVTHFASIGTHYALNLPAGKYELLVLADGDQNDVLDQSEIVGRRQVVLSTESTQEKVLTDFDINLSGNINVDWDINIPTPEIAEIQKSLFYPQGTIRHLEDPIFNREISTLGMYEPAAFLEKAPTMFYALEEYLRYKIPVIFVHGIGGTPREFIPIWFFYYPSGGGLGQLSENFHRIFLSGKLFPKTEIPMIIIAHSMGGVVAREAFNLLHGKKSENHVALFITIASPLGGHPAAASSEKHAPLVLPSWRDVNPDGQFIKDLYRQSLPATVSYHLLYAFADTGMIKLGENSDGVVPLSSQLHQPAQNEAHEQFGFNNTHTGVLKDADAIQHIIKSIEKVKTAIPESHLQIYVTGGYDVELDNKYNDIEKYIIRTIGKYLAALSSKNIEAVDQRQAHFVKVSQGKADPLTVVETAWLKFVKDFPGTVEP
jgi:triacylglycerol esterase/lipase EstA (alpha/beta hydrolase family)